MMLIPSLQSLVDELAKLPGIGRKTAQRLAFHIVDMNTEEALALAESIVEVKQKVKLCSQCFHITEKDQCDICTHPKRDPSMICVVEGSKDLLAIEKTKEYNGLYHVLHGAISPTENIGPNDLKIKELLARLTNSQVKEIILATNISIEGEATAAYISRLIQGMGITVSRIAHGLPVGGDLEYADEVTVAKSLEGRRIISQA